ncbi:hypothetical protein GWR56_15430 [Mucilaginibacter sp. 14171R-50]|uniref:hypothetical protein n=1 Tax=Mucilaginibacter sp. 14171R-50 TaxID=2703789 RepID=UPI00138D16E4|nr:hypothetical protein [Mucilaginibacter sp. 14171R-50]QHS56868.1 hypothetical protein GWR56_15430 [Mucilaginibacter sp. 14171R-50]
MDNGSTFVKGQKVITPRGEGYVVEISGNDATVKLDGGEEATVRTDELEDDSDAG